MQYSKNQHLALLILRIVIAVVFYVAAYFKLPFWSFTPEGMSPVLVNITRLLSIVEPFGATAVLLGFLTRWAASGLAIVMVGAICVTQFVWGIGFVTPTSPGWNFPLTVLAACLVLMAFGAGRWSIDDRRKAL
jgi:putative oxidoreductase